MKRIVLVLALLLLVGAGIAAAWTRQMLVPDPVPAELLALEDALARPGLRAIGHLDVAHALEVERIFVRRLDDDAPPTHLDDSLLGSVWRAGVDPRAVLDHWVVALTADGALLQAGTGAFPVAALREALAAHYEIEERGDLWILHRTDPESCAVLAPVALRLEPGRVVLGPEADVRAVLERLRGGAEAGVDLSGWRAFREGRTASGIVLAAEDAARGLGHPVARMATSGVAEDLPAIRVLQAGASFRALPPGVELATRVVPYEAPWADATARRFGAWREQAVRGQAERLPSRPSLLDRIDVAARDGALAATVWIDEGIGDEITGLLRSAFQGAGFELTTDPAAERTLGRGELPVVEASLDPARLPAADPAADPFAGPEPFVRAGPFAVGLAARRFLPEEGLVELELRARSGRIPNLIETPTPTEGSSRLRLFATRVVGRDGSELLPAEPCGRDRNQEGTGFQAGNDMEFVDGEARKSAPTWSSTKRLRLAPGATLEDVARVEGFVALALPTAVETVRLEAPLEGQEILRDDVSIRFGAGGESTVRYAVGGAANRIVTVRALNADGAYLAPQGSTASDAILRPEREIGLYFAGRVDAVEVALATRMDESRHAFRIDAVEPVWSDFPADPDAEGPVLQTRRRFAREAAGQPLGECDGGMQRLELPPFALCVAPPMLSFGGLTAQLEVQAPKAAALETQLAPLEIALEQADVARGGEIQRVAARAREFVRPRPAWGRDALAASLWLRAELEDGDGGDRVTRLAGRLVHRLPSRLHPLGLDLSRLGNEAVFSNGFRMQLVEMGRGRMRVDLEGARERVVGLRVLDRAGRPLPVRNVQIDANGGGPGPGAAGTSRPGFHAAFEVSAPDGVSPARLELLYALAFEEWSQPFALTLPAPEDRLARASR